MYLFKALELSVMGSGATTAEHLTGLP